MKTTGVTATGNASRQPSVRDWCGNSSCVELQRTGPDSIEFTSTVDGNNGSVTYTNDEVREHIEHVKAGKWDHLL